MAKYDREILKGASEGGMISPTSTHARSLFRRASLGAFACGPIAS